MKKQFIKQCIPAWSYGVRPDKGTIHDEALGQVHRCNQAAEVLLQHIDGRTTIYEILCQIKPVDKTAYLKCLHALRSKGLITYQAEAEVGNNSLVRALIQATNWLYPQRRLITPPSSAGGIVITTTITTSQWPSIILSGLLGGIVGIMYQVSALPCIASASLAAWLGMILHELGHYLSMRRQQVIWQYSPKQLTQISHRTDKTAFVAAIGPIIGAAPGVPALVLSMGLTAPIEKAVFVSMALVFSLQLTSLMPLAADGQMIVKRRIA